MPCACCLTCFNTLCDPDCFFSFSAVPDSNDPPWTALSPTVDTLCQENDYDISGLQEVTWFCDPVGECSAVVSAQAELRCVDGGNCGEQCVFTNLVVVVDPGECDCEDLDWDVLPYALTATFSALKYDPVTYEVIPCD